MHCLWMIEENNKIFCQNIIIVFEGALLNTKTKVLSKLKFMWTLKGFTFKIIFFLKTSVFFKKNLDILKNGIFHRCATKVINNFAEKSFNLFNRAPSKNF